MKYFNTYVSNTTAAGGNQWRFNAINERTGRIYYKLFAGGVMKYSLLFTNIIDSTFSDGSASHANLMCGEWQMSAVIGVCDTCSAEDAPDPTCVQELTFNGSPVKHVMPGEYFTSDPVTISAEKDKYICLEIKFSGEGTHCHYESVIPAFILKDGKWVRDTMLPFPSMVGCERDVKARLGYIGDSITQGCGTEVNSYTHWGAYLAEMLGCDYSFWNLGLGFGRASDAASDGTWLYKAKQLDGISVCFGVNDILQGRSEEQVKDDLTKIVRYLKAADVRVLLQTVPIFDYNDEQYEIWNNVNTYLRNELSKEADVFFDNNIVLFDEYHPRITKFGWHPNAQGGLEWAKALYPVMKDFADMAAR